MTQEEFEKIWNDDSDSVKCQTSGSTGVPKEIRLGKDFMRQSAKRTNEFFGITGESRLHTCLDFKYIASMMMIVRADVAGCELTSETPSSQPLKDIGCNEKIDLLSIVPVQMDWILDCGAKWNGLRHILIGGSAIPSMMRYRIALSDYDVWESYGMTETASHIALRKISQEETPFKTLTGISVELSDGDCLIVNLPDGSRIITNDMAEVLSENEFKILGRADNCVISGGVKIMPEELERKLGTFIAYNYCISSIPDKKWGEKLVLVVECQNNGLDAHLIRDAVGVRLRQYRKIFDLGMKAPKDVMCITEFPKTANGKIDRRVLKKILHQS